jgi:hypothetical protein
MLLFSLIVYLVIAVFVNSHGNISGGEDEKEGGKSPKRKRP